MPTPMPVAVAQPACVEGDVGANALAHAEAITRAGARLVVFPELSLTGYDLTVPCVSVDDPRLRPITSACGAVGAIALAGAPIRAADGRDYLCTLAITGEDVSVAYQKMWLHGLESDRFAPGEAPGILVLDGWRLGLAICFDASVPQHAADTAALGIDAYVVSALDPAKPGAQRRRDERMRTRAVTHGIWVILATAAGPSGIYPETIGGSGVWAMDGTTVVQAGPKPGGVVAATLG